MTAKRRHPSTTAVDVAAALDAVYAQVPEIDCRGQCWDACGPLGLSRPELDRVRAAGGDVRIGSYFRGGPALCPALTILNRCSVYEVRPLICRLWGTIETLPCPAGCRPEGGLLSDPVARELLAQVADISGEHEQARQWRTAPGAEYVLMIKKLMEEEAQQRELRRRRATAAGTAVYALGRGRIGLTPPRTP